MTSSPDSLAAIMRRLTQLGSTFQFASSTDNVWTAAECFLGPDDLGAATANLIEEFGADTLLACDVLEQHEEESPLIRPGFGAAAGPMIAMTLDKPNTFRLLTQESAALTDPLPLMSALRDVTTLRRVKQRRGLLYLTTSVGEAAVLRTLGLPAAPSGPLHCLNRGQLKALAASFWNARRLFKTDRGVGFTPVLTNWQPSDSPAQPQACLQDLICFLGRVQRSLNVDLGDIGVWHPSAAERDELDFVIRSGDKESFWSAVYSSVETSSYTVEGFDAAEIDQQLNPTDRQQALKRVRRLLEQSTQSGTADPQLAKSVEMYSTLVDLELVQPICEQSAQTKDPIQKNLLSHLAETTRTLTMQLPHVQRLLSSGVMGADNTANEELSNQLSQRHRCIRELLQLVKAIRN